LNRSLSFSHGRQDRNHQSECLLSFHCRLTGGLKLSNQTPLARNLPFWVSHFSTYESELCLQIRYPGQIVPREACSEGANTF